MGSACLIGMSLLWGSQSDVAWCCWYYVALGCSSSAPCTKINRHKIRSEKDGERQLEERAT